MLLVTWILSLLLALAFLAAGGMKVARPKPALASTGLAWVDDFSAGTVKLIGAVEVVGALGLALPLLTGIAPVLTPVAALCLAAIMVGAVVVHLRRHESPAPAVVLAVLSVVAAVLGFLTLV